MDTSGKETPFRVLSLDGGGMRGIYQASYLRCFAEHVSRKQGRDKGKELDVGKAFDLIVGTSTGGIIACALMAGVSLKQVEDLYKVNGKHIFPFQLIRSIPFLIGDFFRASGITNKAGAKGLKGILEEKFSDLTLGEVYAKRKIALAIPAVDVSRHAAFVFKTAHMERLDGRDDDKRLVDICLATSAAPILRSLAVVKDSGVDRVYADGGLWANNPGTIGMIEALEINHALGKEGKPIQLYMLGSLPAQGGWDLQNKRLNKGFLGWGFGVKPISMSLDSQAVGYDYIARKLGELAPNDSFAYRMYAQCPPNSLKPYLTRMEDARLKAMDALSRQACSDADFAWGMASNEKPLPQLKAFKEALELAPDLN